MRCRRHSDGPTGDFPVSHPLGGSVPTGKQGRRSAATRQFVGKVLRRGAHRLDAAQARLLAEGPDGKARPADSVLRVPKRRPEDGPPAVGAAREAFFRVLEREGDLPLAAMKLMREYIACGA